MSNLTHFEFWLLDLDRCLIDTEQLADMFFEIVDTKTDISRTQLSEVRQKTEQSGGSFDAVSYIERQLSARGDMQMFDEIAENFIATARLQSTLLPGARQLIDALTAAHIPHGILTYGGTRWQRMKIAASGLDNLRVMIVDNPKKGVQIAAWQQPDETFLLPRKLGQGVYASVVLVDDKASSFEKLPQAARGFHVLPHGRVLPSQAGDLPANVRRVAALGEIDLP